ncbi:MAG: polysaccharide biosynthesis protein, partial [Clostridia bacterium]|nr:polysaccharide biosynthesis protein [Clostridia bacterium]
HCAILAATALIVTVFRLFFSIYGTVWRYPSVRSYLNIVLSDFLAGMVTLGFVLLLPDEFRGNIDSLTMIAVVTTADLVTLFTRFCYQLFRLHKSATKKPLDGKVGMNKIGIAIIGAGQIGTRLAEELNLNPRSHYKPICFIDNDPAKIGARIQGLDVLGEDPSVIQHLKNMPVQEIFIALPNISSERTTELYKFFLETGCKIKMYDYPTKDIPDDESEEETSSARRKLRELRIEDLLFRDPLVINDPSTRKYYRDKTVLVTGGGGSIGSELCRQIAKCRPKHLVILDIYENNAYAIQQELMRKYKDKLNLSVEIGSVRDVDRIDSVFRAYRPNVVFHAAAHKHVPLMEHSSSEAIKNNVMGTYNVANAAERYEVEKFILVSTDKAVNPTNIMGASKRMCEMVVQCRTDSKTSFAAVRFGNVLGSNGSVIPLFREQIEKGGPVTITDKRIIRYFMTIPEASQLVMQAGAMAKCGELFVLDMGKPVRILDLAENMIKLSGLVPYKDIDIVEVGLRPGEKLFEELLMKSETLTTTPNELIFIEKDTPLTREQVEKKLTLLQDAVKKSNCDAESPRIKRAMKMAVPTYNDPEFVNQSFDESDEKKLSESEGAQQTKEPEPVS